jgi:hypothetical protein
VNVTPYGYSAADMSAATTTIRVYRNAGVIQNLAVRPRVVTLTADGNDTITGLSWRAWGATTTQATGTNHVNNCLPNCSSGHIARIPTTLTLSRPGYYRGHYVYKCYAIKPAPYRFGGFCL